MFTQVLLLGKGLCLRNKNKSHQSGTLLAQGNWFRGQKHMFGEVSYAALPCGIISDLAAQPQPTLHSLVLSTRGLSLLLENCSECFPLTWDSCVLSLKYLCSRDRTNYGKKQTQLLWSAWGEDWDWNYAGIKEPSSSDLLQAGISSLPCKALPD